jgi:hypothetical protein
MTTPACEARPPLTRTAGDPRLHPPCDAPATDHYRYTCACGHVADRWTCPAHRPEPGAVGCRRCLTEAGHECPMTYTPAPADD